MEDLVDIHTHILPGLDDGARSMETSLMMTLLAVESGVSAIIATPHANQRGMFENYASGRIFDRLDELKQEVRCEGLPLDIYLGMEVYATEEVPRLIREKKLLTLNHSRYLLIEFGFYSDIEWMEHILFRVMDTGCVPIVAHPERYVQVQEDPEAVFGWMEQGMGIQLNKGSFFGRFGREACDVAHELTAGGLVGCIASDAHSAVQRTTDMEDIAGYISYTFSEETAERLLSDNPRRILENRPLLATEWRSL